MMSFLTDRKSVVYGKCADIGVRRIIKIEKRGDEIKKKFLLWYYWANLNQTLKAHHYAYTVQIWALSGLK
jgi:hypothetical protein